MEETNVISILNDSQLSKIIKENQIVVVDFYANWCNPCKALLPVLDELSLQMTQVKVCKVNCEDQVDIVVKYSIRNIPTLFFFKDGQIVKTNMGFITLSELTNIIKEIL